MEHLMMQYFLNDDEDDVLEELMDFSLPKAAVKSDDDVIYRELKNACLTLAIQNDIILNSETSSQHIYEEEKSFDGSYQQFQLLKKRKHLLNSKPTKKKRIKLSQRSSKDVTSDFIDSDIEDEQIQKFIKSRQKKQYGKMLKISETGHRSRLKEIRLYDPFENKTDEEFFMSLRVTKTTYDYLVQKIKEAGTFSLNFPGGNYPIRAEQALQMFLFYMGQRCTYKVLADMFQVSESAIMSCFLKCVDGINRLDDEEISWPSNSQELEEIQNSFQYIAGMHGVVGSIGGCCVEMRTNKEPPAGYKIGKLRSIMYLLAVTDAHQRFLYIQAGFPGTFSVQEAFESSSLGEMMKTDSSSLFTDENTHLIGTSDFSLHKHLIIPYSTTKKLSPCQRDLNKALTKTNTVEKTFLSLKSRFNSLREQLYASLDKIPNIIKACCIIHNISLRDPVDSQLMEGYMCDGFDDYSIHKDDTDFVPVKPEREAFEKRSRLSQQCQDPFLIL